MYGTSAPGTRAKPSCEAVLAGDKLICQFRCVESCSGASGARDEALRETPLSEPKNDEAFKVVDRRLFTAEGELRKDVAEQQDLENAAAAASAEKAARNAAPAQRPQPQAPGRSDTAAS